MAMLQRVFRDAVEDGEVAFSPLKAVQNPSPGPTREAHRSRRLRSSVSLDLDMRGYEMRRRAGAPHGVHGAYERHLGQGAPPERPHDLRLVAGLAESSMGPSAGWSPAVQVPKQT